MPQIVYVSHCLLFESNCLWHALLLIFRTIYMSYIVYIKIKVWLRDFDPFSISTQQIKDILNEAMRVILGCTRDTSDETIRYLLGLPT